jgi:hypothetical protein
MLYVDRKYKSLYSSITLNENIFHCRIYIRSIILIDLHKLFMYCGCVCNDMFVSARKEQQANVGCKVVKREFVK